MVPGSIRSRSDSTSAPFKAILSRVHCQAESSVAILVSAWKGTRWKRLSVISALHSRRDYTAPILPENLPGTSVHLAVAERFAHGPEKTVDQPVGDAPEDSAVTAEQIDGRHLELCTAV